MATVANTPRITTITLSVSSAGPFFVGFRLFDHDAVDVYLDGKLLAPDQFSVSAAFANGYDDSASILLVEAAPIGAEIRIEGAMRPARNADYTPTDPSVLQKINNEFGRVWATLIELRREASRSLRVPNAGPVTDIEAGRVPVWTDDGFAPGPNAIDIANAQDHAAAALGSAERAEAAEAEAEAILASTLRVFPSVAAMTSYGGHIAGRTVTTLGYFSPGDGGGHEYRIVAAGTGTHDGGSYIDLPASGLQAEGVFTGHVIQCEKFGAVDDTEASAAINAANAYVVSRSFLMSAGGAGPASRIRLKLTMNSAVQIKDKITISNASGYNMDVDFRGALIVCVAGGNLTPLEPAMTVYGSSSIRFLCRIHCNKLCSGYLILTSANSKTYGAYARWIASAVGAYGIKISGANGASRGHTLYDPCATEWEANNPEADDTNAYLATGVVIDDWDGSVYGGHPGFCGVAMELTAGAGNYFWDHPHPFCNNARDQATYPRQDPIAILCNNTNRCYINAPYIDSGYIVDNGGAIVIEGPGMQFNSGNAMPGLSQPYVRVRLIPVGGGANRTIVSGVSTVIGYFDTDYKVIDATGATFAASIPGYAVDGRFPEFFRQRQVFYNNASGTLPSVIESQKGGGTLLKRTVFTGNVALDELRRINAGNVEMVVRGNRLQCDGTAVGDGTSGVLIGQGGNGLRFDPGTGSLHMLLDGVIRWNINGVSKAFVPGADNEYNIGAASLRPSQLYAVAGTINTSDAREKQDITDVSDEVLDAWGDVRLVAYRWIASVAAKGSGARTHHGLIAQGVRDAFAARGLDATEYGLLCYDQWDEVPESVVMDQVLVKDAVLDDEGNEIEPPEYDAIHTVTPAIPAGDRWGIRADQCLFVEAAYQRRRADRIEARLEALEALLGPA